MFRITVKTDERSASLQLEGRLAGDQARMEVQRCWRAMRTEYADRPLHVDLRAVTFMDEEGRQFLREAYQEGASFIASGCLTKAYVEEITHAGNSSATGQNSRGRHDEQRENS